MELEGTLLLERSPTRRWVSIIAIVIPVASVVMVAAWFIRAYVAPPSIAIPSPMLLAAAPPAPSAPAAAPSPRIDPPDNPPATVQSVSNRSPDAAAAPPVSPPAIPEITSAPAAVAPPMVAALAAAPPNFAGLSNGPPAGFPPLVAQGMAPETPALESAEPLKGPVPLPRHRPHLSVALVASAVPLPRPRPAVDESTAPIDLPAYDRHLAE